MYIIHINLLPIIRLQLPIVSFLFEGKRNWLNMKNFKTLSNKKFFVLMRF